MTPPPTFADCFRHGRNRFGMLRHLLAFAVLSDHAFVLTGQHGLLAATGWRTSLGSLAVAGFFLLSGALVTASWLQQPSLLGYGLKRLLRLLPGYVVCLAVTAVVIAPIGWMLEHGSLQGYWNATPGPLGYMVSNSLLLQLQPSIAGLFADHVEANTINGSLWSIAWEAACYAMVALLGITGVLAKHRWLAPTLALAALTNALVFPPGSVLGVLYLSDRITLLPIYFLSGATFYLYRQHIPRSLVAGVVAVAAVVAGGYLNWPVTALLFLPYAFFFVATAGVARGLAHLRPWPDLSYGIYIYGFPLQQLLLCTSLFDSKSTAAALELLGASLILVLPVALLSWKLVEEPSLRFKPPGFRPPSTTG